MPTAPLPLIDVLSDDSFAKAHVPGAVNICVYETSFIDKVREAFPDTSVKLTVYGWDDSTREARLAVERLTAAGYTDVDHLPGGLSGWKGRGGEIERGEDHSQRPPTGKYILDPAQSFIHWTGRNLFNYHHGSLSLSAGSIALEAGAFVGGQFTIDMRSLRCFDLEDSALNKLLIAHLFSDDFFSVEEFPTAEFVIASASLLGGATTGSPNYRIRGSLTLRGVKRTMEFPAVIAENADGGYTAQAFFDIDRTEWGALYGSGKFFARLGRHVVNDEVHLHLKIVTTRQPA